MSTSSMDTSGVRLPDIRPVNGEAPWQWLAAGWRDLVRHPGYSLGYGLAFALSCWIVTGLLVYFQLFALVLPIAGALVFGSPLLAVGLYEMSRRNAAGEPVTLGAVAIVRTASPTQIAFMGVVLGFFALAWLRFATLLFALFFGEYTPPMGELMRTLLLTMDGFVFLAVGSAIGAGLGLLAFAISALSLPHLMARESDAVSAMILSVRALRRNFWPMLLWAWLLGVLTALGLATLYVGFIVIFPLAGHATWHAYRALVAD